MEIFSPAKWFINRDLFQPSKSPGGAVVIEPLALAFPKAMPELETSRLILKEINFDDADALFTIYSHEPTMRSYGLKMHVKKEETSRTIEHLRREFENERGIRFGMFLKPSGILVGDCGIWHFDRRRARGELGAKMAAQYQGQGLMSEALCCVALYAFVELKLHALEGNIATDNIASIRTVEKLGFIREGLRREFSYCVYDRRFKDSYVFSLLKPDFMRSVS